MKAHPLWRLASLLPLLLGSCAFTAFYRAPRQAAFNEADFSTYAGPGTASVTGQLICSYEGQDHPGQGTPVTLLPVTAYTKEMIDRELAMGSHWCRPIRASKSISASSTPMTKATSLSVAFPPGSISSTVAELVARVEHCRIELGKPRRQAPQSAQPRTATPKAAAALPEV
jgi:hypothetical protein